MRNPFRLFRQLSKNDNVKLPLKERISISLGGDVVVVEVVRSGRKSMALSINAHDQLVRLKIPAHITTEQAMKFVDAKKDWVINKRREFESKKKSRIARGYCDGDTHLFLGEKIQLRVLPDDKSKKTFYNNNVLTIFANGELAVEKKLRAWYKSMITSHMLPIIVPLIDSFLNRYGKTPSDIEYKFVKSYWGVCTNKGLIRLNIELMRAPVECVEYIMAHELCHLVHQNHSSKFYDLLTEFMPDWRQRKALLEKTISIKD